MNSVLNINVRVAAQQARAAVREVEGDIKKLQAVAATGGRGRGGGILAGFHPDALSRFGKNLQWTGRQLEFSFTLPLLLAGAAATKWELDNQRAMVGVRKVYGDGTESAQQLKAELDALGRSFELLSSRFGVHQDEVITIAGEWAQAGAAGAGLARSVRLTLETMILGQLDAQKTTEGLIGIQSVFRLSTAELRDTIATLNIVENQTGIRMGELIDVLTRAGGTAKTAGVQIRELVSMAAALVPAAGSGAQAGNALRTIISRIQAPTRETAQLLALMGINVQDASWQAQDAFGRIQTLAKGFGDLSDAQKTVVSSSVASRWQLNRFDVLMDSIANNQGFFKKAMDVTAGALDSVGGASQRARDTMQRELLTALESQPQRWAMLTNVIRNTMTEAIQPILPYLIIVLQKIVGLAQGFTNLAPETKGAIAALLVFLVVLGPLTRYIGAVSTLIGTMGQAFLWLSRHMVGTATTTGLFTQVWQRMWMIIQDITATMYLRVSYLMDTISAAIRVKWAASSSFIARIWGAMWRVVATVLGPVGRVLVAGVTAIGTAINTVWAASIGAMALPPAAMVTAVIGAFVLMIAWIEEHVQGGFVQLVRNIGSALSQLPRIVGSVFVAVARTLQKIMEMIVKSLFRLSPFTRHSPSLVDEVIAGVSVILSQYARLNRIPAMLRGAMGALAQFRSAAGNQAEEIEFRERREQIVAVTPTAGPAVDELWATIKRLRPELEAIRREITYQESVVGRWERALAEANSTLEESQRILDDLKRVADNASAALSDAKAELDRLRDIPIQGWGAMDDAIFENEMAINELTLAILRMEDAGMGIDEMKDKMSRLAGEIEMLRADATDLRNAGAGSDVLGPIEDQIALLEQQRTEIGKSAGPIDEMRKKLDDLQRQGQILDLERSIQFDPLRRQIDAIGLSLEELPFDQLFAAITSQVAVVNQLEAAWKAADAAVTAQQATVDQHQAARDSIQQSYDREKAILDDLKNSYQAVEGAIREMEQALSEAASAASKVLEDMKDLSMAQELFQAAEGFDFEDVGGVTGIGREGDLLDIEAFNKEMEAELAKALKDMDIKIDLFKPIKDQFVKAWEWIKRHSTRLILGALAGVALAIVLGLVGWPALIFVTLMAGLNAVFGGKIAEFFKKVFLGAVDAVKWVVEKIIDFFKWLYDELIGHSIIPDLIYGIIDWFKRLPGMLLGVLGDAIRWLWETGRDIVLGLVKGIGAFLGEVWKVIGAIASGIWTVVSNAGEWLFETGKDIILGLIKGIKNFLSKVWEVISEIASGIWEVVSGAGEWLFETGKDIILGLVNGLVTFLGKIWEFFSGIPAGIWRILSGAASWLVNTGKSILIGLYNGAVSWIGNIWNMINDIPRGIWTLVSGAGKWLYETGRAIIIGLWNGFASWIGGLWDRLTGWAGDVLGWFQRTFRLGSPSRVMADIGKMLGQGLANGMMSESDRVAHAAQTLANAAMPNISDLQIPSVLMGDLSARMSVSSTAATGGGGSSSALTSVTNSERRVININGNLEFPNLTDPADAEEFIRNLEALTNG